MATAKVTTYKALTGLDTCDGQRFEAGDTFKAADIPKAALDCYLEMNVIEAVDTKPAKEPAKTEGE